LIALCLPLVNAAQLHAQGCLPIRYTSPTLGQQSSSPQAADQWQIALAYRWVHASRFYSGPVYHPEGSPVGPTWITVNTVEVSLSYAPTSRVSVSLGVPVASGMRSGLEDDSLRHDLSATGIGDLSLLGTVWLLNPPDHVRGNIAFGFGVKAPTGSSSKYNVWHTKTGVEQRPLDESIQLGDGGWGAILRTEAFRQVYSRIAAYAAASYLANPRGQIAPTFTTPYGVTAPVAVNDEYSAHAGITMDAWRRRGLSLSLGGRIDGVPVRDAIGGGDEYFRRPGYVVFAEPALAIRRSRSPVSPVGSTWSVAVPIRVDQYRHASLLDLANQKRGGGDFPDFLIFIGYAKRW